MGSVDSDKAGGDVAGQVGLWVVVGTSFFPAGNLVISPHRSSIMMRDEQMEMDRVVSCRPPYIKSRSPFSRLLHKIIQICRTVPFDSFPPTFF